jgi:hypothetical protein
LVSASAVDCELVDDIEVFNHLCEFIEANFSIMILIGLDDSSINKLLQLHVIEVVSNHHLEHGEKLSVRDEAVSINVVNLKSESQLLLLARASRERVKPLHKF